MNISPNVAALGNDIVDLKDRDALGVWQNQAFLKRVFTSNELDFLKNDPAPEKRVWQFWAAKEAAYKALKQLAPKTIFSPRRFEVDFKENLVLHEKRKIRIHSSQVEEEFVHLVAVILSGFSASGETGGPSAAPLTTPLTAPVIAIETFENLHKINAENAPAEHSAKGGMHQIESALCREFCLQTIRTHIQKQAHSTEIPFQEEHLTLEKRPFDTGLNSGTTKAMAGAERKGGSKDMGKSSQGRGRPFLCLRGVVLPIPVSISHHGRFCAVAFSFQMN